LETGVQAARLAGTIILEKCGSKIKGTKLNSKDLVTEADLECQNLIESFILQRFPEHSFLGEEQVAPGIEASKEAFNKKVKEKNYLWIVDPIDGTINFVHNQPMSAVSIGLFFCGNPIIGIIYEPFRDEMFTTVRGQGSYLNYKKISVSKDLKNLSEALIAVGSPYNPKLFEPFMRSINHILPKALGIRITGSSAITFAWIACGRIAAYWEVDLSSWDSAAGALIVHEAGGKVSDLDGSDYKGSTRAILATNGSLHAEMLRLLTECNGTQFKSI